MFAAENQIFTVMQEYIARNIGTQLFAWKESIMGGSKNQTKLIFRTTLKRIMENLL